MKNMEKRDDLNLGGVKHLNIKASVLALLMLFSSTNFSFGKNNEKLSDIDETEQMYEGVEKTIEDYQNEVNIRNKDIQENTTEKTLEKYLSSMKSQFYFETRKNNNITKRINEVKNILNSKYSKNISNDDAFSILQTAFKVLSNTEKYRGLGLYSNNFSDSFDMNFVNALGFVQYMNDLTCNWNLTYGGSITLDNIISDLNNLSIVNFDDVYFSNSQGNATSETEASKQNSSGQGYKENQGGGEIVENPKVKVEDPKVKVENPSDSNAGSIQQNEDFIQGVQLLSDNLSSKKLNGVTYEEVRNAINSIDHEGLRNAVLACFLRNDVIGAQKLLGMDVNCNKKKYPNYVASEKIGRRELNLIEQYGQTRRLMEPGEIMNYFSNREAEYAAENNVESFTYEVKTVYKKFLSGEIDNKGLPYCIISKYDYRMYLFSADHKLVSCHFVLTGADKGNEPNDLTSVEPNQSTPGGKYTIKGLFDQSLGGKEFWPLYGTGYFTLYPNDGQYVYSKRYTLGMHGYLKSREKRMTAERKYHAVSNGCINCDRATFGELVNHFKEGSIVYVCFDDYYENKDTGYAPENDIELIEHFGYNPGYAINRDDAQSEVSPISGKWNSVIDSRDHFAHNSIINKKLVDCDLPKSYNIFNLLTSTTKKHIGSVLENNNNKPYNSQGKYVS